MDDTAYDKAVRAARELMPQYHALEAELAELANAAGAHQLDRFANDVGIPKTPLRNLFQRHILRARASRRYDEVRRIHTKIAPAD